MYQKLSYYPSLNFKVDQIQCNKNSFFITNYNPFCFTHSISPTSQLFQLPLKLNSPKASTPSFQGQRVLSQSYSDKQQTKNKSKKNKKSKRNFEKEIISAKKNSQSNIINQFFSFYGSRIKSQRKVEKIASLLTDLFADRQKIIMIFYLAIKILSVKRKKRYINKAILFSMFDPESLKECEELTEKAKSLGVSLDNLGKLLRRCTTSFLKDFCIRGILTSKRIGSYAKFQHLKRRRIIMSTFLKY